MRSSTSWKVIPSRSPYSAMTSTVVASQPAKIAPYRAAVAMSEPVLSRRTDR